MIKPPADVISSSVKVPSKETQSPDRPDLIRQKEAFDRELNGDPTLKDASKASMGKMAPSKSDRALQKNDLVEERPKNNEQTTEALLQSITLRRSLPPDLPITDPAISGKPEKLENAVMDRIVDKLLVNDPSWNKNAEVRITIKNHILKETEVIIKRQDGIQVEFVTGSDDVYRFLATKTLDLQQHLSETLGETIIPRLVLTPSMQKSRSANKSKKTNDLFNDIQERYSE